MATPSGTLALQVTGTSLLLTLVLLAAGLGAAAVVGIALAALARRRTVPYLLVALAVGAILLRTVVGGLSMQGALGTGTHHLAEHVLDVLMVGLVIAAVLLARGGAPAREP